MGKAKFYLHDRSYWLELEDDVCDVVMAEIDRLTPKR